jgi:hypothetical protein
MNNYKVKLFFKITEMKVYLELWQNNYSGKYDLVATKDFTVMQILALYNLLRKNTFFELDL